MPTNHTTSPTTQSLKASSSHLFRFECLAPTWKQAYRPGPNKTGTGTLAPSERAVFLDPGREPVPVLLGPV